MQTALQTATAAETGGELWRRRLTNRVVTIFREIDNAPRGTRRGVRAYRQASARLKTFATMVGKRKQEGKLRGELPDQLTGLADRALGDLLPLTVRP